MKKLFTFLGLAIAAITYAQQDANTPALNHNDVSIVSMQVAVNSAEDLEETFKLEDLEELMNYSNNETVTFKLKCNGSLMTNGNRASMSYEVNSEGLEKEAFLQLVKKIRKSAIQYYQ